VVCWGDTYFMFYGYGYHAIGGVTYPSQYSVAILGSGFTPGATVTITYCDEDIFWAEDDANECGAFIINTSLPSGFSSWTMGVITVRAWEGDELMATWPLFVFPAPS